MGRSFPFLATLGQGLLFPALRLHHVVRVSWLPLALLLAGAWFMLSTVDEFISGGFDEAADAVKLGGLVLMPFALLLLLSMLVIAQYRVYFADERGWIPVYFRLTVQELAMFAAFLIAAIVVGCLGLLYLGGVGGTVYAMMQYGVIPWDAFTALLKGDEGTDVVVNVITDPRVRTGVAVFVVVVLYVMLRFSLAGAVIAAEGRRGLSRSWIYTRRHAFWLILVIAAALAVGGAITIALVAAMRAVSPDMSFVDQGYTALAPDAHTWPAFAAGAVGALITLALYAGVTARAYEALSSADAPPQEPAPLRREPTIAPPA
jgi:hypothetical protein